MALQVQGMNGIEQVRKQQQTHMLAELASWKGSFPTKWGETMLQSRDAHEHYRRMRQWILEGVEGEVEKAKKRIKAKERIKIKERIPAHNPHDEPMLQWFGMDEHVRRKIAEMRPDASPNVPTEPGRVIFHEEAERNKLLLLLPPTP